MTTAPKTAVTESVRNRPTTVQDTSLTLADTYSFTSLKHLKHLLDSAFRDTLTLADTYRDGNGLNR